MGMSISLKKDTRKTNIRHNNRDMNEKEMEANTHIDARKSPDNVQLVRRDIRKLYRAEFGESQEKYNEKQKRNDRKIPDYYKHLQKGKKTSLQQEMIVQIGDKDDFAGNEENREMAGKVLEDWFRDFEKRNPQLKVYNAVIHQDEASPHMHLNFVPVATGYKRGLEKQVSFDRAIKQQDPKLDQARPFDDWREKEVAFLEKGLSLEGIEREKVGTNAYEDVTEYKEKQRELEAVSKELERQRASLRRVEAYSTSLYKAEQGKKEKRSLGILGAEIVELPKESYEKLHKMASEGFHADLEAEEQRSLSDSLRKQLQGSNKENERLSNRLKEVNEDKNRLEKENKMLHKAILYLKTGFHMQKENLAEKVGQAKVRAAGLLNIKVKDYPTGYLKKDEVEGAKRVIEADKQSEQIRKKSKNRDRGMGM